MGVDPLFVIAKAFQQSFIELQKIWRTITICKKDCCISQGFMKKNYPQHMQKGCQSYISEQNRGKKSSYHEKC